MDTKTNNDHSPPEKQLLAIIELLGNTTFTYDEVNNLAEIRTYSESQVLHLQKKFDGLIDELYVQADYTKIKQIHNMLVSAKANLENPDGYDKGDDAAYDFVIHDVNLFLDYDLQMQATEDQSYILGLLISSIEKYILPDSNSSRTRKVQAKIQKELTFADIFKPEYRHKLQELIKALKDCKYLDDNGIWRTNAPDNDPGKVYKVLSQMDCFSHHKPTNGLKVFCKEFGISVYESGKETRPHSRAVSSRNLLLVIPNNDEENLYKNQFRVFLTK